MREILRADLRDLQNLSHHAGKVPDDLVDVYRRRDRHVLRLARSCGNRLRSLYTIILIFSLVGIAVVRRRLVRHPREYLRKFRTAFASLRGKPYPIYSTPLQAGMSIMA